MPPFTSARRVYYDDQRAAAPLPRPKPASPTSSFRSFRSFESEAPTSSTFCLPLPFVPTGIAAIMPSSKGEPTDPELREKVKEEVKAESKGGGEGKWSAWKAGEMAKRYEAQGGDYEDKGEHKNKSQKGAPEKK